MPIFNFDNTYASQLEGFYTSWQSTQFPAPELIKLNHQLAAELAIDISKISQPAELFSGNLTIEGASPLAQVYAGHQFGHFAPQLGDGRALLLGEVISKSGQRFDIQLKGSGRTPYSRGGDGKSALGPVLREYVISEAMHVLGIATTRALAAVSTGETVMRTEPLPGAVFTRVAASHIRIGTFEFFAAQGEHHKVKQLADYAIARHYSELVASPTKYLDFLKAVGEAQAALIASWMHIGFIHGVMNTDNMTISGETIDYGPCAFMDAYAIDTVFSSIDSNGRYAYQNQPAIGQWNLTRLAEALLPLVDTDKQAAVEQATQVLNEFPGHYHHYWLLGMRKKLGLASIEENDMQLMNQLLASLDGQHVDFTQFFRHIIYLIKNNDNHVFDLFDDASAFKQWLAIWNARLERDQLTQQESIELMMNTNPVYIARNHLVEEALELAVREQDYSLFEKLNEVLAQPYIEKVGLEDYAQPAPKEFGRYTTFCGT